jgi:dienelactone hydrolase
MDKDSVIALTQLCRLAITRLAHCFSALFIMLTRFLGQKFWVLLPISFFASLSVQAAPSGLLEIEFVSAHADANLLKAYISRASQEGSATKEEPVVVALHGCDGLWSARGDLGQRYREYQAWLNARGLSLLLVDSFSTRGKARGICTEPLANRTIRPADRKLDVQGAVQWLQNQPWVDKNRLFVLGWSHGGSTVLSTLDHHVQALGGQGQVAWPSDLANFKAAIAYYPGCGPASQNSDYHLDTPLLLMIGEDDDWTPARPCERFHRNQTASLAKRGLETERFQLKIYPGAHHGFDSSFPVRHRPDVPNGNRRGQGVTAGGHPPSREDAFKTLEAFLRHYL